MTPPAPTTPDRRELRRFGLLMGGVVGVLFGAVLPLLWGRPLPLWPWGVAAAFGLAALAAPAALGPVYRVWMKVGAVVGAFNTRLILGIVYYLVITPVGVFLRLARKDPLRRRPERGAETYRVPSTPRAPEHMERPY